MPSGGKLKISATNERLEGEPDGLRGEHVALRVVDTGTGMNSETMERVFEPFFTTKGFGEGTGLGLSQVFGFTKQLGGTVTVESEVGKGSTFTLYLPASRSPVAGVAQANGKHSHGRVLVVEDDDLVAELAAGLLNDSVTRASSRTAPRKRSIAWRAATSPRRSSPTWSCPAESAASSSRDECATAFPSCRSS